MYSGFSSACVFILPLLGRRSYPRFRDCFVTDDDNIGIYTKVGGPNRGCGYGEEALYQDENFLRTYDDPEYPGYATYEFRVPKQWKKDFALVMKDKAKDTSEAYKKLIKEYNPTLAANGSLDSIFYPGETSGKKPEKPPEKKSRRKPK